MKKILNFKHVNTNTSDSKNRVTYITNFPFDKEYVGPYIIPVKVKSNGFIKSFSAKIFRSMESMRKYVSSYDASTDDILCVLPNPICPIFNEYPNVYNIIYKDANGARVTHIGEALIWNGILLGRTKLLSGDCAIYKDTTYVYDSDNREWWIAFQRLDTIKNYKGGLKSDDVRKVSDAIKTISTMWVHPSGGFYDESGSYQYIDFIDNKKSCLKALDIIKQFIEEFAPDIKDEE